MKTIFFGRADEENDMVDKVTDAQKETPIRIDHDNVDVADIMDQIKRRIAQKPPAPADVAGAEGRPGDRFGSPPAIGEGWRRGPSVCWPALSCLSSGPCWIASSSG